MEKLSATFIINQNLFSPRPQDLNLNLTTDKSQNEDPVLFLCPLHSLSISLQLQFNAELVSVKYCLLNQRNKVLGTM